MSKKERKKERVKDIVTFSIIIGFIASWLYYNHYDFDNSLYNGLLLLVISILLYGILDSDKYYIETGCRPEDKENVEQFNLFNQMHPFLQLYDKILIIVFFVMLFISLVMIARSFFE